MGITRLNTCQHFGFSFRSSVSFLYLGYSISLPLGIRHHVYNFSKANSYVFSEYRTELRHSQRKGF